MAIRSTNPGKVQTPGDSQRTIIHELRELKRAIVAYSGGLPPDAATETTLVNIDATLTSSLGTIESLLQDIETGQDDLITAAQRANWTSTVGNSIEYAYYAGVAAGNPSGTVTNVETATYKTGATAIFTQTFAYNAADLVISITTA